MSNYNNISIHRSDWSISLGSEATEPYIRIHKNGSTSGSVEGRVLSIRVDETVADRTDLKHLSGILDMFEEGVPWNINELWTFGSNFGKVVYISTLALAEKESEG